MTKITDGDALEAFSDLIDYYEASECGKIAMRYAKFDLKIAYKTVKAALHSTRKTEWMNDTHACMNGDTEALKRTAEAMIKTPVPVDTINIKKEVLQGVRDSLELISSCKSQISVEVGNVVAENIASLDAVLSEGES